LRDLITAYLNKHRIQQPTSGPSTDDQQQIYTNLEVLNIGNNQNNNIVYSGGDQNQSFESDISAQTLASSGGTSSSNPPTPARRNKTNQITRDAASSPLLQQLQACEDPSKQLNIEGRGHTTMSPLTLPLTLPGASSNENEFEFVPGVQGGATTMAPPAASVRHNSRRQPQLPGGELGVLTSPPQMGAPKPSAYPKECIVCNELMPLIIFESCSHQICCEECGVRMKKCLACGVVITSRLRVDGKVMQAKDNKEKEQTRHASADRVKYLERKIVEIEETHCCSIW
jgi:E3 ubiquitin-protein ligase mind-bomb